MAAITEPAVIQVYALSSKLRPCCLVKQTLPGRSGGSSSRCEEVLDQKAVWLHRAHARRKVSGEMFSLSRRKDLIISTIKDCINMLDLVQIGLNNQVIS